MISIRKWLYKPKKNDSSLLAQFFFADEELNQIAAELDSFDGRKDPERCTALVNQLRQCQDKVLGSVNQMMDVAIVSERANRDFRVKFPDDVLQDNLFGQLWFGAECLAAGSSIMNREVESHSMRPLAKAVTRCLDHLRLLLRDQALRNCSTYSEKIKEALKRFDKLFAEFELSYVSAMVPVKTMREYDIMQDIIVLFSETVLRALKLRLLVQEQIDDYDPGLMFTIPRLAIVCGLIVYPEGPLNVDQYAEDMSDMFRPFQSLLYKVRELLWTLSKSELYQLEKTLCSTEEPAMHSSVDSCTLSRAYMQADSDDFIQKFYRDHPECEDFVKYYNDTRRGSHSESGTVVENISEDDTNSGDIPDCAMADSDSQEDFIAAQNFIAMQESFSSVLENMIDQKVSDDTLVAESEFTDPEEVNDQSKLSVFSNYNESLMSHRENGVERDETRRDSGIAGVVSPVSTIPDGSDVDSDMTATNCRPLSTLTCDSGMDGDGNAIIMEVDEAVINSNCAKTIAVIPVSDSENSAVLDTEGTIRAADLFGSVETTFNIAFMDDDSDEISSIGFPSAQTSSESVAGRIPYAQDVTGATSCVKESYQPECSYRAVNENATMDHKSETNNDLDKRDFALLNDFFVEMVKDQVVELVYSLFLGDDTSTSSLNSVLPQRKCDTSLAQQKNRGSSESLHLSSSSSSSKIRQFFPLSTSSETLVNTAAPRIEIVPNTPTSESTGSTYSYTYEAAPSVVNNIVYQGSSEQLIRVPIGVASDERSVMSTSASAPADAYERRKRGLATVSDFSSGSASRVGTSHGYATVTTYDSPKIVQDTPKQVIVSAATVQNPTRVRVVGQARDNIANQTRSKHSAKSNHRHSDAVKNTSPGKTRLPRGERTAESSGSGTRRRDERYCTQGPESPRIYPSSYAEQHSACYYHSSNDCRDWDSDSFGSGETSSYNSECNDDEEIALAIQAAEISMRNEIRAKYRSSDELIHRLFVCISGVADQLQTNYASDLRNILKCVFELHSSPAEEHGSPEKAPSVAEEAVEDSGVPTHTGETALSTEITTPNSQPASTNEPTRPQRPTNLALEEPPAWAPDDSATSCSSCKAVFTVVRRRHHCRNCGKIFCARCSCNSVPLPRYGHLKPVRVCNRCYMYHVTPFTVD